MLFLPEDILNAKMQSRFDFDSVKVIVLAQEEARRMDHNFVGAEQILLAMIVGNGTVAKALQDSGLTLKDARNEVAKIIGRGFGSEPVNPEALAKAPLERITQAAMSIPFTREAKAIFLYACDEADQLQSATVKTEHLLLGLIRSVSDESEEEKDKVALSVLQNLLVDSQRLRFGILEQLTLETCG